MNLKIFRVTNYLLFITLFVSSCSIKTTTYRFDDLGDLQLRCFLVFYEHHNTFGLFDQNGIMLNNTVCHYNERLSKEMTVGSKASTCYNLNFGGFRTVKGSKVVIGINEIGLRMSPIFFDDDKKYLQFYIETEENKTVILVFRVIGSEVYYSGTMDHLDMSILD